MNHEDPIIDPLLEELLGEQQMPDLTARILKAHQQRQSQGPSEVNGHAKAPLSMVAAATAQSSVESPAAEVPSQKTSTAKRRMQRQRLLTAVGSLALSLCLLVVLSGVAYVSYQQLLPGQGTPLAADGDHTPSAGARDDNASTDDAQIGRAHV